VGSLEHANANADARMRVAIAAWRIIGDGIVTWDPAEGVIKRVVRLSHIG